MFNVFNLLNIRRTDLIYHIEISFTNTIYKNILRKIEKTSYKCKTYHAI